MKCQKIDRNSFYPSLFTYDIIIKWSDGKFMKIDKLDDHLKTWFYYVRLIDENKLFNITKINENGFGWYNNYDILSTQQFNLKFELNLDVDMNCVLYNDTCNVRDLFEKPMLYLYYLKTVCITDQQKQLIKNNMIFFWSCI